MKPRDIPAARRTAESPAHNGTDRGFTRHEPIIDRNELRPLEPAIAA